MAVSPEPAIWLQCRPLFQSVLHHVDTPVTCPARGMPASGAAGCASGALMQRSEEHTSELQSRPHLVCRLLLEKKKLYEKRNRHQYAIKVYRTMLTSFP